MSLSDSINNLLQQTNSLVITVSASKNFLDQAVNNTSELIQSEITNHKVDPAAHDQYLQKVEGLEPAFVNGNNEVVNGNGDLLVAGGGSNIGFIEPVTLTTNTSVSEEHFNREIIVNSETSINIQLPATITEGYKLYGVNIGSGLLTFTTSSGGEVTANDLLPSNVDQYSPFEIRYLAGQFIRVA